MKRLLVTSTALALMASPALAWNGTNNGSGPFVEQGTAVQNTARAEARSSASAQARGGNARASGGSSNVTVNEAPSDGSSGRGGGNVNIAPSIATEAPAASGECEVVGLGIGGTGMNGAGLFSWSHVSRDCNERHNADTIARLWGKAVARAYLMRHIDGIDRAVADATQGRAAPAPAWAPAPWCATASVAEQERHYRDCFVE